jgi:hypothetical protein
MTMYYNENKWKKWLKLNRLLPTLTVLGSASAIVLSLIGIIKISLAENIIVALIGLVAVDALSERISFLKTLERKLDIIMTGQSLRTRKDILDYQTHTKNAFEICMLAISAPSIPANFSIFKNRIREGCKIRIVLLNPKSPSFYAWNLLRPHKEATKLVEGTLERLKEIFHDPSLRHGLEVRLSDTFMSYSLFCVDGKRDSGSMILEFYSYKREMDERPHIHLTASENPFWFGYYMNDFEAFWADAEEWVPDTQEK